MGDNQVKLIEGYLEAKKNFENSKGYEAEVFKAKIEGIVFAYESYSGREWAWLMEDYKYYMR